MMHPVWLTRWMVVLVAMVAVGLGCAHTQPPEREVHVISEDASGVGSNVESPTGGAGIEAYCNELQKQCFRDCWRRAPRYPSIRKHSENHHKHCTSECLEVFMKCVEQLEEEERQEAQKRELHFPTMKAALAWLREHKAEVAIGTVVIVGGVVAAPYAIALLGGALVLAPL